LGGWIAGLSWYEFLPILLQIGKNFDYFQIKVAEVISNIEYRTAIVNDSPKREGGSRLPPVFQQLRYFCFVTTR
jgi:hypothetical protein